MTLTGRLALGFAALAATVAALIGGLGVVATDRGLEGQTRSVLLDDATTLAQGDLPDGLAHDRDEPDGDSDEDDGGPGSGERRTAGRPPTLLLAQVLSADGTASGVGGLPASLPVDAADRAVAGSPADHDARFREITVDGSRYLLLTRSRGHGQGAVQVARSLADQTAVLRRLGLSVVAIAVAVTVCAAVAGLFLARALTRRLVRLAAAAEQVAETGRLDVDVRPRGRGHGRDEVGRLGKALDDMLARLARSRDDQQRLVQNAGHELRTPLTSIRTNVALLRRADELPPGERAAVLDDLAGETRELTQLVDELVELATDRRADEPESDVDLVALSERVAARARRRHGRRVQVTPGTGDAPASGDAPGTGTTRDPGGDLVVRGRAQALERALTNLVDNAIKFDAADGGPVEVVPSAGPDGVRVEVRDRGPGILPEDLGRIFDRFHRATSVRSLPGSGLGLSIVREVVVEHDGSVFATARDGGGAVIGFTLPASRLQTGSYPG